MWYIDSLVWTEVEGRRTARFKSCWYETEGSWLQSVWLAVPYLGGRDGRKKRWEETVGRDSAKRQWGKGRMGRDGGKRR